MTNKQRAEKALEYKHKGYNCCQAVTAALADITDLTEKQLLDISAGFGAGMGNMEGTCGALVGAVIATGSHTQGNGSMRVARQISEEFANRCGSIKCKEIKGIGTGRILCSCDECVQNAVEIFCKVLAVEE
ncbi:MAG: C_GCAxxG_C_C family protein [Bacteroidales bacterium]|nr:C_GCAxxG_C_C family protein [Bacteroidales bacterium]